MELACSGERKLAPQAQDKAWVSLAIGDGKGRKFRVTISELISSEEEQFVDTTEAWPNQEEELEEAPVYTKEKMSSLLESIDMPMHI